MSISSFFQKLVPTDQKFFPMFEHMSDLIQQAAIAQQQIFENDDPVKQKDLFKQINEVELKGDGVAHNILDNLDRSFVPPFDREDIHKLTTELDLVIDLINKVTQRIRQYRPKEIPSEFRDFSRLISGSCEQISVAVHELRSLKKPGKILKACKKIAEYEKTGDELYHTLISGIFKKEKDAIELIKQKEILENLESITDSTKDVAGTLRTIILKMA